LNITADGGCEELAISYLENFLANVVMNAAHMKVPSIASIPAINLNMPMGL
jgi:hypothetical protein